MVLSLDKKTSCENLFKIIKNSKNIILIGHLAPDPDTIGSVLALKQLCKQIEGVRIVDTVISGEIPDAYRFLPDVNSIVKPDDTSLLIHYDLAIAVDVAAKDRLGYSEKLFDNASSTAVIDHHGTNPLFAGYNLVDKEASATGELIYDLMNYFNLKLTPDIAINIYTAILTDTGGFKFSNTSQKSLQVCAEMVSVGVSPAFVYQQCYENRPIQMIKLHAHCALNVNISEDKKYAWCVITRELLRSMGAEDQHTDGVVEFIRQIDSIEIAVLFKETMDGNIKVSLRSKEKDICTIAREFNGGGHIRAAGCTLKGVDFEKAKKIVLPRIEAVLNK